MVIGKNRCLEPLRLSGPRSPAGWSSAAREVVRCAEGCLLHGGNSGIQGEDLATCSYGRESSVRP